MMWFHYILYSLVHEHLNNTFPNRWIGHNGIITCPARPPNLTLCNFICEEFISVLLASMTRTVIKDLQHTVEISFN